MVPYAQIGTRDDEDKPTFASLRPGQKLDKISFDEAIELFKLPRTLGETAEGRETDRGYRTFRPLCKVRR